MIIYIYDIKTLTVVARPVIKNYEEFKAEPTKFYPDWDVVNHLSAETEFQNPIMNNGVIRDKTREELIILDNKTELLQDGEYIENNKIIVVDPPYFLYKKSWNKETNIWEEGATSEEVTKEMYRLFDEYIYLDEQKSKYEANKFPVLELENKIAENIMKRDYLSTINPIL